jgi:hypothetical protein
MNALAWAALIIVGGQGVMIAALFLFVQRFGMYTKALKETHESNMLVYRQALKILDHAAAQDPAFKHPHRRKEDIAS